MLRWLALFVGVWALALAMRIPAGPVLTLVAPAHLGQTLRDPSGTLWAGGVSVHVSGVTLPLRWDTSPAALWRGCAAGTLSIAGVETQGRGRFEVCPASGEAQLQDVTFAGPAADWNGPLAIPGSRVAGRVSGTLRRILLGESRLLADGEIRWSDARVTIDRAVDLGTVEATLTSTDKVTAFDVDNDGGDLTLRLHGQLAEGNRYRLTGTLDPGEDQALRDALVLFGDQDGEGRVSFRASGALRAP